MIQDSRGPEMFAFVAELEGAGDTTKLATGLFRDSFGDEVLFCSRNHFDRNTTPFERWERGIAT